MDSRNSELKEIGKRVYWSERETWGTVIESDSHLYPLRVRMDFGGETEFTEDGRHYSEGDRVIFSASEARDKFKVADTKDINEDTFLRKFRYSLAGEIAAKYVEQSNTYRIDPKELANFVVGVVDAIVERLA